MLCCPTGIFRSPRFDSAFQHLPNLLFVFRPGGTSLSRAVITSSAAEALISERELLNGETSPLRAATGFVFGTAMCGVSWAMAGLLAWSLG
jgi:hypothetical protein